MTETATVEVYEGHYDEVPSKDPEWSAELEIERDWWGKSYPTTFQHGADSAKLADDVEFTSGSIEIWCEAPEPVFLCVHTNDHYHDPDAWGKPMERGLTFGPDSERVPFGCEVWGRVLVWVAARETDEAELFG